MSTAPSDRRGRRALERDGATAADLAALVASERGEVTLRIADLEAELDEIIAHAESSVPDDEHDSEGSTIGYERARVGALLDLAGRHLLELDAALRRVERGVALRCASCAGPIGPERLAALAATTVCASCAIAGRSRHR
ncbi:MAG TPA: hypothetical protein VND23_10230 [Acidimicrobiales bacterium]|nr:hypothetical protein [Acidimicrobiales bacterium]